MDGPATRGVALKRRGRTPLLLVAMLALGLMATAFVACSSDSNDNEATDTPAVTAGPTAGTPAETTACPPAGSATSLTGAGATFPGPLYTKWIEEYKTKCNVEINYQAIGSGGGVTNITNKTVDYGASDAILSADEEAAAVAAGGPILHIPMTIGGIAVVTSLPDLQNGQLKLKPDVLAKIYLGEITKWSDPAIAADNTGLTLPDSDIAVVHRSDGSGTTFQFTDYLAKVSPDWQSQVGSGKTVEWPVGVGGEKNDGVAAQVQQLPNSIGYVEVAFAIKSNLIWAAIGNKGGTAFVEPTLEAIGAAAAGVTLPDDMKILLSNSDNPEAYPISGFTWILVYQDQTDAAKAQTLLNYLWWSIHDGQQFSEALTYATLPDDAVTKAETLINSVTVNGQPVQFK